MLLRSKIVQTIIWIIHFLKPHITVQNSKLFKHRKQIQIQWLGFQVLETFAWFAEWLESWSHEAEINVRDNQPQNHFCISCIYVLIITLMLVCVARKKKKICDWQQQRQAIMETGRQMTDKFSYGRFGHLIQLIQ